MLGACLTPVLHMQVADAAQKCIGVRCFRKEQYPLPDKAAAAFNAASEQVIGKELDYDFLSMSCICGAALTAALEIKSPYVHMSSTAFLGDTCTSWPCWESCRAITLQHVCIATGLQQ